MMPPVPPLANNGAPQGPPMQQVEAVGMALLQGKITQEQAIAYWQQLGLSPEQINAAMTKVAQMKQQMQSQQVPPVPPLPNQVARGRPDMEVKPMVRPKGASAGQPMPLRSKGRLGRGEE